MALAHITAARTGHAPWRTAHTWLERAAAGPLTGADNATLWFGAPALALLTTTAAMGPAHLATARARLEEATERLTRQRLERAHARIDRGERPPLAEFDLIQGLAGLGAYHLHAHPEADITSQVLSYLVRLTLPLPGDPEQLPGWWSGQSPHGTVTADFPGGHANLGMAHGIAAPLAVLSLALRQGVTVDGDHDAIGRVCAFLDTWRNRGPKGAWWPYYITRAHLGTGPLAFTTRQRPSWCYGTPGLARTQQLAALALGDEDRRAMAEQTMADCLRDPAQLDSLTELGLCHGWAGLLHCAWRINSDAPGSPLSADLDRIADTLISRVEATATRDPEFLDGSAGIALALHTLATGSTPAWDACLALA
ncbi:hypothetical protein GCM10009800_29590 [Nocardiopsis rhodophaea]